MTLGHLKALSVSMTDKTVTHYHQEMNHILNLDSITLKVTDRDGRSTKDLLLNIESIDALISLLIKQKHSYIMKGLGKNEDI